MIFLNPLNMLIPKNLIFIFAKFWIRVTSVTSPGGGEGVPLSPLWGGGGAEAPSTPSLGSESPVAHVVAIACALVLWCVCWVMGLFPEIRDQSILPASNPKGSPQLAQKASMFISSR